MTDKKKDGRSNNRPPEHSKIRRFEVRNEHGRKGKPPPATPPNKIDEMYLEESERIVSHDDNGPVSAARRLVQEEYRDALKNRDPAARARVIDQVARSADRQKQHELETLGWLMESKATVSGAFYDAKLSGLLAPNILPHPAHVDLDEFQFVGPMTPEARDWWQNLKGQIRVLECCHGIARFLHAKLQHEVTANSLLEVERARRKLMRKVPKGWNWRENIHSRGGKPRYYGKIIADLNSVFKELKGEWVEIEGEGEVPENERDEAED